MKEIEIDIIDREEIDFNVDNSVVKVYPNLENLEITPSKEEQTFKSKDYYGYDEVKVNGVTNEIDNNIAPENIKQGIDILGVTGNVEEINTTEISINPSDTEQVVTPEAPYNGFSKVTVGAQSGVNLDDYISATITSSNRSYFGSGKMFKKLPIFKVEGTSLAYAFANYSGIIAPQFEDTSNVKDWNYFLGSAGSVTEIPAYDTSSATNVSQAFNSASIKKIALLDFGKVQNINGIINAYNTTLTDIGGFKDLGKNYLSGNSENYSPYTLNLSGCSQITYNSAINILNNLYDIASIGVKRQRVRFNSNVMTKLQATEEGLQALSNADTKGWNITT